MIQRTRADLLAVAQRHDPALVEELMNSAVKEKPEDKAKLSVLHNEPLLFGSSSAQKRSQARLAASLAATQPAQALNYALDRLGYGVPLELQQVFKSLIAADAGKAHELFIKASVIYQMDPSLNLYDPLILASYLKLIPRPERDRDGREGVSGRSLYEVDASARADARVGAGRRARDHADFLRLE